MLFNIAAPAAADSMLQIKNFRCCVVKEMFRNSFVLPKKYSVREINNFPKRYMSMYNVGNYLLIYFIFFMHLILVV